MEFLTLADWTGMLETELFAQIYKSYGRATVEPLRERAFRLLSSVAGMHAANPLIKLRGFAG